MPNNGPSKESTRPKPKNGQETKKSISKRKVSTIIEERGMKYESYFTVYLEKHSNLFLSDDHGPDENSESETVSIKNIQFLTEAENTGLSLGLKSNFGYGPDYSLTFNPVP